MVCVLLRAYAYGHRSSGKIKRLCERDAGFRMIVGDEVPDHSVIARFRKRHRKELMVLFVGVLRLCRAAGLIRLDVVASDGTKIKTNAALDANQTAKSLDEAPQRSPNSASSRASTASASSAAAWLLN